MTSPDNLLMVADSAQDANMLYAVGMFVPDPFIYLRLRGRHGWGNSPPANLSLGRSSRWSPGFIIRNWAACGWKMWLS